MSIVATVSPILAALAALLAVWVSYLDLRKTKEIHLQINSRLDELLKATSLLGRAEGRETERKERIDQPLPPPIIVSPNVTVSAIPVKAGE